MYIKVECYFLKNGVLVFSFMYLVLVDAMERSFIMKSYFHKSLMTEDVLKPKKIGLQPVKPQNKKLRPF